MKVWKTSRRLISLERPLVMGILNITPDSFSDGGKLHSLDAAVSHAEKLIEDGADILDIGGESTRPGSSRISEEEEARRVLPVIDGLAKRLDIPISIDTTKAAIARASLEVGAEIINDISGLRWDDQIAALAAKTGAGLVLMHSRGAFETMHSQPSVADIFDEVTRRLQTSIDSALRAGIGEQQIVLDIGLGFGKTFEQNLELLSNLGKIVDEFDRYPLLVGASRKSFIGKMLGNVPPSERIKGSVAAAVAAVERGAAIVRVHDVKETVAGIKAADGIEI
jgi:dihydropteroate synthase